MDNKKLSRRDFLRMSTLTAAGAALAGCATPTPEVIKEVVKETVEVPVAQTVEVEVKETVEVEKIVEVTAEVPEAEPVELRIAWWGFKTIN